MPQAGLLELVAHGIQDIYLICNPQITFFKTVYKRHTNFSMEYLEEQLIGTQNFGGYLTSNLSKTGDLLHKLYLKINIPQVAIEKNTINTSNNNSFNESYKKLNNFFNSVNFNIVLQLYKFIILLNLSFLFS